MSRGNEGGDHWRHRTFQITKERGYAETRQPSEAELEQGKRLRKIEELHDAQRLKAETDWL